MEDIAGGDEQRNTSWSILEAMDRRDLGQEVQVA